MVDEHIHKKRLDSLVENSGETVLSFNFVGISDQQALQALDALRKVDAGLRANIFHNNAVI